MKGRMKIGVRKAYEVVFSRSMGSLGLGLRRWEGSVMLGVLVLWTERTCESALRHILLKYSFGSPSPWSCFRAVCQLNGFSFREISCLIGRSVIKSPLHFQVNVWKMKRKFSCLGLNTPCPILRDLPSDRGV